MDCDQVGVRNRWIMMESGCREWTVLRRGCDEWGVKVVSLIFMHHIIYGMTKSFQTIRHCI